SLGGAVLVRVAIRTTAPVEPSLGLTLGYLPNDFLQSPNEVVVRWTSLALVACPGWGFRHTVVVEACALGAGGWVAGTARAVNNPRSAGRPWWAAGATVRAALPLGAGLALELDAGAVVPLVKRRFVTTTPDRTVAETPAVSPLVGFGLVYR